MRRLTLRGNMIEDQGAMDLAEPMRLFSELEFLDLGGNLVQADGAGRLAEGLRECRKLRHLDLNCNRLAAVCFVLFGFVAQREEGAQSA
eukprot:3933279-Rhodomonas_salina.1